MMLEQFRFKSMFWIKIEQWNEALRWSKTMIRQWQKEEFRFIPEDSLRKVCPLQNTMSTHLEQEIYSEWQLMTTPVFFKRTSIQAPLEKSREYPFSPLKISQCIQSSTNSPQPKMWTGTRNHHMQQRPKLSGVFIMLTQQTLIRIVDGSDEEWGSYWIHRVHTCMAIKFVLGTRPPQSKALLTLRRQTNERLRLER